MNMKEVKDMRNYMLRKVLAITTIGFFIGLGVMPSINAGVESSYTQLENYNIDVKPTLTNSSSGALYKGIGFIFGRFCNLSEDHNFYRVHAVLIFVRIIPRSPWGIPWRMFNNCEIIKLSKEGWGFIFKNVSFLVGLSYIEVYECNNPC